jgi:hypothetical protein
MSALPAASAPGGAPLGFGSTTHRVSHRSPVRPHVAPGTPGVAPSEFGRVPGSPAPPPVGAVTQQGYHINVGARGAPLMMVGMQREVEQLREQLVYQHELAEANAAKVRQLEREAAITTSTFDARQRELQQLLAATREELSKVKEDRDTWQKRAVDAEERASDAQVRVLHSHRVNERRGSSRAAMLFCY